MVHVIMPYRPCGVRGRVSSCIPGNRGARGVFSDLEEEAKDLFAGGRKLRGRRKAQNQVPEKSGLLRIMGQM